MLRYPTGDIASWTDFSNEIFTLHGRDANCLKICNTHLPVAFLRESIENAFGEGVSQWSQFVARREGDAQELTFRVVTEKPKNAEGIREKVNIQLCDFNSNWRVSQANVCIAPLQVDFITVDQLQLKSSGKVSDVGEERFLNE